MFLLKSLIGIPIHDAAHQGRVRGLSRHKRRPRPLLLERLENRLCLSLWSQPVNLGPMINTSYGEIGPALSPDGLSLYFSSARPGGFAPPGDFDIWVSQRASLTDPWGPPQDVGSTINSPGSYSYDPRFSPDGHQLFFTTNRPGGYGQQDLWVSARDDTHDDFGWQTPVNLGPGVNSPSSDSFGASYFEDNNTGITTLYFSSDRPNFGTGHVYASTLQNDGTFGAAVLVPKLSGTYSGGAPTIRSDGLEIFFPSGRPGGLGSGRNIWVSTRASTLDPWPTPVNLGAPLNNAGFETFSPVLSSDGNTMFFDYGGNTLYMSTRLPLVADHFTLSVSASTTAGQTVPLTLTAWDHYGNIATGYTGTVTFTSTDPQATLPASYTFTAADNGTYAFDSTVLTAGAQSIKVIDPTGVVIGAYAGTVVNPAPADHFLITAAPSALAGTPFDVTLTAFDPYGNVDTNYSGTVTLASSDPQATLPADYTFTTADSGTHTFSGVTLVTAGAQTLSAQDTANSSLAGSATVAVVAAPADHFQITAPATAVSGTPFDVTITALDPYGNVDMNYTGTITWTSSDTDPRVILPADYTFQATDSGTHTFAAGFTLITPGDQTLTVTDTVSGFTGSATVTVTPSPHPPGGGGARSPWIPSLNTEVSQTQGPQIAPELTSVDRLFSSLQRAGLLWIRRKHDVAADDIFGVEE